MKRYVKSASYRDGKAYLWKDSEYIDNIIESKMRRFEYLDDINILNIDVSSNYRLQPDDSNIDISEDTVSGLAQADLKFKSNDRIYHLKIMIRFVRLSQDRSDIVTTWMFLPYEMADLYQKLERFPIQPDEICHVFGLNFDRILREQLSKLDLLINENYAFTGKENNYLQQGFSHDYSW